MAQVTIRANLSSVQIPLLTEEFGRSVIVRGQDLNYNPTLSSKTDADKDIGIPQVYYGHNLMPTNYGYRSIAYSTQINAVPAVSTFNQVFNLISVEGVKALIAFNTDGSVYNCYPTTGYVWHPISEFYKATITEGTTNTGTGYVVSAKVSAAAGAHVYLIEFTTASAYTVKKDGVAETPGTGTTGTEYVSADGKVKFTINSGAVDFVATDNFTITTLAATLTGTVTSAELSSETYFCIEGSGIFQYDFTGQTLIWRSASGLLSEGLLGITASNGYLIAYSVDTVAWSSVIDPLDFVPSLSTGAGSGSVEDAKGPIKRCVGLTSGFLVFTARNVVAAVFGNNIRYPFTFREVPNGGGISDLSLVTDEADSTAVYAFTTYGLQQISSQKAVSVLPELSDMLTGKRFEDFDTPTLSFTSRNLTAPIKKRVEFVSGRFLVVSYGVSEFTHAVVHDTALQRFGKLKVNHSSIFQYGFLDADDADTAKKQIAILAKDGTVRTVEFAAGLAAEDSVALVGKFQYVRQRLLQLDSVELETIDPVDTFNLYTCTSGSDGKTLSDITAGAQNSGLDSVARKYYFRKTAINHSLLLHGTFRLNSLLVTFNTHGVR